jgi:inner membrane protein
MLPLSHIGFTTTAVQLIEKGLRLRQIDYRVLIAASLLPDLIDKPLTKLLAGSYEYESRSFGHSLAFLSCIALLMLAQWGWNRSLGLLPVFFGVLFHDVLDGMWLHPGIFFWPIEGWRFPKPVDEAWQGFVQMGGYRIKQLDFLDNISVLLLLFFFMRIALTGRILEFIRTGKL